MIRKTFILAITVTFLLSSLLMSQHRGTSIRRDIGYDSSVGKQYVLLIAINDYLNWDDLNNPVREAKRIKKILEDRYYINNFIELYNENASKANIIAQFETLRDTLEIDDSLVVLYSGHGNVVSNNGYWIPYDGGTDKLNKDRWINNSEIRGIIAQMKTKHILLLLDCCYAGSMLQIYKGAVIDSEPLRRAYSFRSRYVLTSGDLEYVPDKSDFAQQLALALEENNEPYLEAWQIYDNVKRGVKKTLVLFGETRGCNHQLGSSFLLFLKKVPQDWQTRQTAFETKLEKAPNYEGDLYEKKRNWERILNEYKDNNPFTNDDELLRGKIHQNIDDLVLQIMEKGGTTGGGGKKENKAYNKARRINTIASYTKYINDFPLGSHKAEAYYNCGVIHFMKGRYEEAIEWFNRSIRLNPKDGDAYNNRGVCRQESGKSPEEIKTDYENAIKRYKKYAITSKKGLNRKLAIVHNNLGIFYSKNENRQDAINEYNKAIDLNKEYGNAYYNLGVQYLELSKQDNLETKEKDELIEKAITNFNSAIKYNKKDWDAYERLTQSYEKKGNINEAQKTRAKAVKLKRKNKKT